jgi:hypothetical protein
MKPDVPLVLQHSFGKLLLEVAPNLTAEYAVGNTSVIGLMMFMSAAEFERGAQLRAEENAEMRAIFEETGGLGLPGDLQKRLGAAAGGREASLLISDLDAENDRLKTLLIELQAALEELDSQPARKLGARIWGFLRQAAEKRKLPYPSIG